MQRTHCSLNYEWKGNHVREKSVEKHMRQDYFGLKQCLKFLEVLREEVDGS